MFTLVGVQCTGVRMVVSVSMDESGCGVLVSCSTCVGVASRDGISAVSCTGGATTTGPDATYPPGICQNSGGGGGGGGGRVGGGPAGGRGQAGGRRGGQAGGQAGGLGGGGGQAGVKGASDGVGGGGVRVRVTELVEPVLVL